jgi:AcrR family transcriptional regulator
VHATPPVSRNRRSGAGFPVHATPAGEPQPAQRDRVLRAPVSRTRRSAAQTREHVLEVAHELFYWRGIRATGIDLLAARAGVAPPTLYRLFRSKDHLVSRYLERADRLYRQWFTEAVESGGADPAARVLALFDALTVQVQPEQCRGCPFQMALTEFPDAGVGAHHIAVGTKAWVRDRFRELTEALAAERGGGGDPGELADQLALLMEGVYASAQALSADGPARRARSLAEKLVGL